MNRLLVFFLVLLAWPAFGQQTVGVDKSGAIVAPPWAVDSANGIITNIVGGTNLSRSGATVTIPTNGSGGGGGSQTPVTNNIDGAEFSIFDLSGVTSSKYNDIKAPYYVSTNGNDANTPNQALSPLTPWLTMQHAETTAPSNSTVLLFSGQTFQYNVPVRLTNALTWANYGVGKPIIFSTNYLADGIVEIAGNSITLSNLYFSGITNFVTNLIANFHQGAGVFSMTPVTGGPPVLYSNHVVNCTFTNLSTAAMIDSTNGSGGGFDWEFIGDSGSSLGYAGIYMNSVGQRPNVPLYTNTIVSGATFSNVFGLPGRDSGTAVALSSQTNLIVTACNIHDNGQSQTNAAGGAGGIVLTWCNGYEISFSKVHDIFNVQTNGEDGIGIDADIACRNGKIHDNLVYHCQGAGYDFFSAWGDVSFYHNLAAFDGTGWKFRTNGPNEQNAELSFNNADHADTTGITNFLVYSNILIGAQSAPIYFADTLAFGANYVSNNILLTLTGSPIVWDGFFTTFNSNDYWAVGNTVPQIFWNNTNYSGLTAWQNSINNPLGSTPDPNPRSENPYQYGMFTDWPDKEFFTVFRQLVDQYIYSSYQGPTVQTLATGNLLIGGGGNLTMIATNNVFVTPTSGTSNTTGSLNYGGAQFALSKNTTGSENFAPAIGSLQSNTIGSHNSAGSPFNQQWSIDGSFNDTTGEFALQKGLHASNNVSHGFNTMVEGISNQFSTAIGENALNKGTNLFHVTAIGDNAGSQLLSGSNDVLIGASSGSRLTNNESGDVYIDNLGVTGESNTVRIGSTQTNVFFPPASVVNGALANFTNSVTTPILTVSNGVPGTATNAQTSGTIAITDHGTNVFTASTNKGVVVGGSITLDVFLDQVQLNGFHLASTNSGSQTANLEFDNGTLFLAGTETIGASGNLDLLELPALGVLYNNGSHVVQATAFNGSNGLFLSGANTWVSATNLPSGENFTNVTLYGTTTIQDGGLVGAGAATFSWGGFSLTSTGQVNANTVGAYFGGLTDDGNFSVVGLSIMDNGGITTDGSGNVSVVSLNQTGTRGVNQFYAGPSSGGAAAPAFRSLTVSDLPAGSVSVASTVVFSNIPPLTYYTNTSGSVQFYSVTISNQVAAVVGNSTYTFAISNANSGGWSNQVVGLSTLITSIAMNYTNDSIIILNTNAVLAMTNTSSGVGNAAGEVPSTGQIVTIGNATASGVASLGGNNVFTGNNTISGGSFTLINSILYGTNSRQLLYLPDTRIFTNNLILGDGGLALNLGGTPPTDPDIVFPGADSTDNTFIGIGAGVANTTGGQNTFVGEGAGSNNINGTQGTFIGQEAGRANTSGYHNTAVGEDAMHAVTTGFWNTALGCDALNSTIGTNNVGVGTSAGTGAANSVGSSNVWVGSGTGTAVTTGSYNTVVGQGSGTAVTTASDLTIIGQDAGTAIVNGGDNIVIGYQSALGLVAGTFDIAIGESTMNTDNNGSDTTVGTFSYENGTGANNTSMGQSSLHAITTGNNNSAYGYNSGLTLFSGGNDTFIGAAADVSKNASTNLNFAMAIGSGAVVSNSHTIVIGTQSETTLFPGSVTLSNTATMTVNGASGTNTYGPDGSTGTNFSSIGNGAMVIFNYKQLSPSNAISDFATGPVFSSSASVGYLIATNPWPFTPLAGTNLVVGVQYNLHLSYNGSAVGGESVDVGVSFTNSTLGQGFHATVGGGQNIGQASIAHGYFAGLTGYSIWGTNTSSAAGTTTSRGNIAF